MTTLFDEVEEFFGLTTSYNQNTSISKKRTLSTAFESFESDAETAVVDKNTNAFSGKPPNSENILKFDWSIKRKMVICSSISLPISVKSSNLSFEMEAALALSGLSGAHCESPLPFDNKEFYRLFPYYIYPADSSVNISSENPFLLSNTSLSTTWMPIFKLLFHQFENNLIEYFYILNWNCTLLFLSANKKHQLRIRTSDRRVVASLEKNGFISMKDSLLTAIQLESPISLISLEILEELEHLENLTPGSTYVSSFYHSRLHQAGRLFPLQQTEQYNRMIKQDDPFVIESLDSIKELIYFNDIPKNSPLSLFLKVSNPIIICPQPFIGGTAFLPQLDIDKPIKTIMRHPETGNVHEKSSFKITFSGLFLPSSVNAILSSIVSYFDAMNGEFSISLLTDINTQSLNIGESNEAASMSFLSRIHYNSDTESIRYSYMNANSPFLP